MGPLLLHCWRLVVLQGWDSGVAAYVGGGLRLLPI